MSEPLPKNWLVVRMSHLGDVALATGVLDHFARTRGWRFHFLTRQAFSPVLKGNPIIDKLVQPEADNLDGLPWLRACRDLAAQYDGWGLLDLHGTLRSMVLGAVWKGPVKRYPKYSLHRRLYSMTRWDAPRRTLEALNVPQRYALAVEKTAPSKEALRPRIHLTEAELTVGRRLAAATGEAGPVAVFHPYATHAGKRWPTGHWEELAFHLHVAGWRMAVVGRDKSPIFAQDPPDGIVDFTNQTDIRQTCALIALADALVTADSGPMHLGTAVGTRTVALFGPTTKAWGFFPSGEEDVVMETPLDCRPCSLHGGKGCRQEERCMHEIRPEDVAKAVIEGK